MGLFNFLWGNLIEIRFHKPDIGWLAQGERISVQEKFSRKFLYGPLYGHPSP